MPRNIGGTLLKLFFLSLVVGIVLSVLDIDPEGLLGAVGGPKWETLDIAVRPKKACWDCDPI